MPVVSAAIVVTIEVVVATRLELRERAFGELQGALSVFVDEP
ncbi:hypothetical protein [Bradyrhizobium sp. CCGUVB1N3]|nr:hypothetical protein [Bradyrhizobium sp. CCGUVB1N3]